MAGVSGWYVHLTAMCVLINHEGILRSVFLGQTLHKEQISLNKYVKDPVYLDVHC